MDLNQKIEIEFDKLDGHIKGFDLVEALRSSAFLRGVMIASPGHYTNTETQISMDTEVTGIGSKALGNVLKSRRDEIGLKSLAVAGHLSISPTTLWTYEKGEEPKSGRQVKPSEDNLRRLAEYYGLNYDSLRTIGGYES